MKNLLRSVVFGLSLSLAGGAIAQSKEDRPAAEQALKEGIKAYKDGNFEASLDQYKKAASLAPSASGPYREMGKVYEALGREEDAKFAYQEYLRRKPDADDASEIKSRISTIEARKPSKGSVFLPTAVAGVEIWVDGKLSATSPMAAPLALPAGSYQVELRQGSTVISKETVSLGSGEAKLLSSPESIADKPVAAEGGKSKRSPWFWVAGSAVVLGVGVGTAVAIDELSSGGGGGKDDDKDDDDDKRKRSRRLSPLTFTVSF
jgi:tetratricopeptide (TPR) repeat protein